MRDSEKTPNPDTTLALVEELRSARETNLAMLQLIQEMRTPPKPDPDPWAKRAEELKEAIRNRPLRDTKIFKDQTSPYTGAIFDAVVVDGIVTQLQNYRYPDYVFHKTNDHEFEGGRVPVEMIEQVPKNTEEVGKLPRTSGNMPYLHWLYETTYQPDLRSLVGNPLNAPRFAPKSVPFAYPQNPEVSQ